MFRTVLDHAVVEPGPAARITYIPHLAGPAVAEPGPAVAEPGSSVAAPGPDVAVRGPAVAEPGADVAVARPRAPLSSQPGPAAPGGRVISPSTPQPPQLGDEPPVYDDGVLRITRIPGPGLSPGPGYELAGEIDESTVGAVAGKLAELAADLDEIHLDLGALDYSDLAGLRMIVRLAAGRRRVVLHHMPAHLRAVLAIVGWDAAPGLELAP